MKNYDSRDDLYIIKIKHKTGKWSYSRNCIGEIMTCSYWEAFDIFKNIKYNHPVVCVYNISQSHLSMFSSNGHVEMVRKDFKYGSDN